MITINKILVPTDFSDGAGDAYPVAQKIADTFGGKIDFIHIIPTLKYMNESIKSLGLPLDMNKDVYPKIIDESEHKISNVMDDYLKEENKGDYFIKINRRASDAIVEFAKKNKYDLIIMGSKGRDNSSLMRGHTTERIIRKSKIPVFSVDNRFDINSINNIVMTTDTSPLSFTAFAIAAAMADTFNSHLTLFHVIELYGSLSEEIPRDPAKGELISIYEGLITRLNDFLSDQGQENIHIQRTGVMFEDEVVITDGENSRSIPLFTKIQKGVSAHNEIENYVSESADLVVMATHGHSGFAHLILGSTAEKVAEYVNKPVLTVRPGKEDFDR